MRRRPADPPTAERACGRRAVLRWHVRQVGYSIGHMATVRRSLVTVLATAALLAGAQAAPAAAEAGHAAGGYRGGHGSAEPVQLPVGFRPEGVESGPGDRYYVGSLADGRIRTGDLSRGTGRDLLAGVAGRSVRGLFRDAGSGLLWAAAQDGATGVVLAVDTRTGEVREQITVPGAVFLNDLVVTRSSVWVTDSRVDRLTRIPLDRRGRASGDLSFLPLTGAWPVTTPAGIGANGIRALPGGALVLDNSTAGGLWTADPRTGAVTAVPVAGGPGITAGDGLELVGRTLFVVRGSGQNEVSVLRLSWSRSGWAATWNGRLTSPDLDVPATATFAKGRLWAVNARFGVPDPATADYQIVPLPRRAAP